MLPFTKLIRTSVVYDNDGNHDYFRELGALRGIPSADLRGCFLYCCGLFLASLLASSS